MPYISPKSAACLPGLSFPVKGYGNTLSVGYLLLAVEFAPPAFSQMTWRLSNNTTEVAGIITRKDIEDSPAVTTEQVTVEGVAKNVTWRRVRLDLGSGILFPSGVIGSLTLSSTSNLSAAGQWVLLGTLQSSSSEVSQSWLGGSGLSTNTAEDAQAVFGTKPPNITTMTVTILSGIYGGKPSQYVRVNITGLGVGFTYEIQRLDTRTKYSTIYTEVPTYQYPPNVIFDDHEVRYGVPTTYRARSVDIYGTQGNWFTVGPVTLSPPTSFSSLVLTSNEDPTLNIITTDTYQSTPARSYEFGEAEDRVTRLVYGRDLPVSFSSGKVRAISFSRRILVSVDFDCVDTSPGLNPVGPDTFDRLRELSVAPVSYICVRDAEGNRFFGSVSIPSAATVNSIGLHEAELSFVETNPQPAGV